MNVKDREDIAVFQARYELSELCSVWCHRRWNRARARCNEARVKVGLPPMKPTEHPMYCWYEK